MVAVPTEQALVYLRGKPSDPEPHARTSPADAGTPGGARSADRAIGLSDLRVCTLPADAGAPKERVCRRDLRVLQLYPRTGAQRRRYRRPALRLACAARGRSLSRARHPTRHPTTAESHSQSAQFFLACARQASKIPSVFTRTSVSPHGEIRRKFTVKPKYFSWPAPGKPVKYPSIFLACARQASKIPSVFT